MDDSPAAGESNTVLALLRANEIAGGTTRQIAAAVGADEEHVRDLLTRLVAGERVIALATGDVFVARTTADDLYDRTIERLEQRQRDRPWLAGSTSIALAKALNVVESRLVPILASFVQARRLVVRDGYYATVNFRPRLTAEQNAFFESVFERPGVSPAAPVLIDELRARVRSATISELTAAFETLVIDGQLVRVDACIYRRSQIDGLRAQLETAIRVDGPITVARFRDTSGLSRKFAVPLLAYFDASGITERNGDLRTLRSLSPARDREPDTPTP